VELLKIIPARNAGGDYSLVGVVGLDFLAGDLLRVDGAPGIDDVSQYEGHEQRHPEHGAQGELAGAGVGRLTKCQTLCEVYNLE